MNIEIRKMNEDKCYQVRIIEHISEKDIYHTVDRITTSPEQEDEPAAKHWLSRWLTED